MTAPTLFGPDPNTALGYVVSRASVLPQWLEFGQLAYDPEALVTALLAAGKQVEAIRCIAVAIPVRQAIWWGWVSSRHALQLQPPKPALAPIFTQLLGLVEQWIEQPTDARRASAWQAAQAIGIEHPVSLAAAAVWFSGNNIAPAGAAAEVPAPAGMAHNFVTAAVAVAATHGDPAGIEERYRTSVAQG
ncbi:MAG: hypothetical protein MUF21_01070, partial [Gemmatimonadaceae bacterium]|nr:hypothetical protein [Gemmatimonadaceae bacterium]